MGQGSVEGTRLMACACGGSSSTKFDYEVKLADGSVRTVMSKAEARILIKEAGGGQVKAVLRK